MKFKTHNDTKTIQIGGTSLKGILRSSYLELVRVFGQPLTQNLDKSDAEWEIEFEDGTIATIYNWKNGRNYLGEDGLPTFLIGEWHVGGHGDTTRALGLVHSAIKHTAQVEHA